MKNDSGKKSAVKKVGSLLVLGLALSACAMNPMFGGGGSGTILATSGPEPGWVKNPEAARSHGKSVYIGDGYDFDNEQLAETRACDLASKRAGVVWTVGGKLPGTLHTWWERTKGVLGGERYHSYCEIIKK